MDKKAILEARIEKVNKRIEKNKTKRTVAAILIIAAVIYIIFVALGKFNSVFDYALGAFASLIGAAVYFYVNSLFFIWIFAKSEEEYHTLEKLQKEYETILNEESSQNNTASVQNEPK